MTSLCSYFERAECRSCSQIEVDYPKQLRVKEERVRKALAPFSLGELLVSVPSPTLGFRNRAKMVVTGTSEAPVIGLAGEGDLDSGRELLGCPIHHPKLNAVIMALPAYIREFNLLPYRIAEKTGELKGLILFYSAETDEMYLRFVLRSKECVSRLRKLLPKLQSEFPSLVVVTANLQPVPHAILEGPEEIYITERKTLRHEIGGKPFRLSPQAFVQTNSEVACRLYESAAEWIKGLAVSRVAELYCGQGAFSFFAAKSAGALLGIDRNADGVKAANESAAEQGLTHLTFKAADAAGFEGEIAAFAPDLILVNPPRRGLGLTSRLVGESRAKHFIYSSCSIDSLALDLEILGRDFSLRRAQIFDMFPHTEHFEILVWLERLD